MTDCVFCSIVEGKSPCFKIWEDENFVAFLDIFPNMKGQTLVIPKKHYESDLFLIDDGKFYQEYLLAAREVVNVLKKGLGVHRVAMVMEGMGVNHLHLKLYPLHGIESAEWEQVASNPEERKFYEVYQWCVSSAMGPKADMEDLGALQVQINNAVALN